MSAACHSRSPRNHCSFSDPTCCRSLKRNSESYSQQTQIMQSDTAENSQGLLKIGSLTLTGRTALVTGAGSGFGAEISRVFAGAGANVIAFDQNGQSVEDVSREISGA